MILPLLLAAASAAPFPAPFVCDGIDRPVAFVVGPPDARGEVAITRLAKPSARGATATYRIWPGDPGAGQVFHALSRGGREVGSIHRVNPGMAEPSAGATTAVVTSMTVGGTTAQCRWLADTLVDGITGRRGVNVARDGGGLVYRTFDFAQMRPAVHPDGIQRMTAPTLTVRGGVARRTAAGLIASPARAGPISSSCRRRVRRR